MQVTGTGHQQTRRQTPQRDDRISYVRNTDTRDYIIRVRVDHSNHSDYRDCNQYNQDNQSNHPGHNKRI